jgi:hypothetical protein
MNRNASVDELVAAYQTLDLEPEPPGSRFALGIASVRMVKERRAHRE